MKPAKILVLKDKSMTQCSQPENFTIKCNKCQSEIVYVTIVNWNKIAFHCENCKNFEE